jgi:hypothetical protein
VGLFCVSSGEYCRDHSPEMTIDPQQHPVAPLTPAMRALIAAAWLAFSVYGGLEALLIAFGIGAGTLEEGGTMFAYAVVLAVPLAIVFTVLLISTRRRSALGLWICFLLAAGSLAAFIALVTS